MKKIKLTDGEIEIINDYVKEASSMPGVSGIYLYAIYCENDSKSIHIVLESVLDFSFEYDNKLIAQKISREIDDKEYNSFCDLSRKYKTINKKEDERVYFTFSTMPDYCMQSMNGINKLVNSCLANSIILFDRFGDIKAKQEEDLKFYQTDDIYLQVENIDSVTDGQNSSVKKLLLEKKLK